MNAQPHITTVTQTEGRSRHIRWRAQCTCGWVTDWPTNVLALDRARKHRVRARP